MVMTNFPSGLTSFGIPVLGSGDIPTGGGVYYFVDSVHGANGYDGSWDAPFATIDHAIGLCTADRGDVIIVKSGHAETLTSAGAITADVAGVTIVGLGVGNDRPTLTFSTSTAASVLVSAADVKIVNIIGKAGINSLANPFNVTGSACELDIEWWDGTYEAVRALQATGATKLTARVRHRGLVGGSLCVNSIRLSACTEVELYTDFWGKASTGVVEFQTAGACSSVRVNGFMYVSGTTDGSKDIVDTATGSTWFANVYDGSAGAQYTGGSGSTYTKWSTTAITDALYGTTGVATWPTAAAYANNVSIAEVLGYVQDAVRNGSGAALATNKSLVDALGTNGTTVTDSAVSVLGAIGANNNNNAYDSSTVVANADGSVLERAEYMQTQNATILGLVGNTPATFVPGLGYAVSKAENVNTATGVDLFTVTGKVLLTVWTGEVTNALGAAVTDYKLRVKGDNVDLCAASNIAAAGVGFIFQMCSDAGDTLINTASAAKTADTNGKGIANRIVGLAGGTGLVLQSNRTAGDVGDAITHTIWYLPLEAGASVAAA